MVESDQSVKSFDESPIFTFQLVRLPMKKLLLSLLATGFFAFGGYAQTLLYDQTANVGTGGILCRTHDNPSQANFNTEGADDFEVPAGETWNIDSVITLGTYNFFSPPALVPTIVAIYNDNNGQPGTLVAQDTVADGDPDNDQDLEVYLNSPISLSAGKYWLSVRLYTSAVPWYWLRIPELVSSDPSHWRNPGGGYNLCNNWAPLVTCLATVTDSSYAYQIYGCLASGQASITPTDTSVCVGESVTLSVSSTYSSSNFEWPDGSTGTTFVVDSTGSYSVTVDNGATACAVEVVLTSNVNVVQVSQPELNDTLVCENDLPFIFQAPSASCANCTNIWPDGSSGIFFAAQSAGTYTLTIEDTVTGCSLSDEAVLSVAPSSATFSPGIAFDVCDGDEVEVSISEFLNDYTWQLFNGLNWITISTGSSATVTYGQAIAVSGTSLDGCYITDTAYITERPTPVPGVTSSAETSTGNMVLTADGGYQAYDWSTGGSNQSITVSSNGLYTVTVTDEYGCQGSKTFNVINVGVADVIAAKVRLYPNPSNGEVNVVWPQQWVNEASAVIYDIAGRTVANFNATSNQQLVDLSGLDAGQYVMHYRTPEGVGQQVLVITD